MEECLYLGKVDQRRARKVASELKEMACYEVSLGGTVGRVRPHEGWGDAGEVKKEVMVENSAVSLFFRIYEMHFD